MDSIIRQAASLTPTLLPPESSTAPARRAERARNRPALPPRAGPSRPGRPRSRPGAHGRRAALFKRLVAHPPESTDVVLEGSSLGGLDPARTFPTEAEVETSLMEIFRRTGDMALVAAPARNINREVRQASVSTAPRLP